MGDSNLLGSLQTQAAFSRKTIHYLFSESNYRLLRSKDQAELKLIRKNSDLLFYSGFLVCVVGYYGCYKSIYGRNSNSILGLVKKNKITRTLFDLLFIFGLSTAATKAVDFYFLKKFGGRIEELRKKYRYLLKNSVTSREVLYPIEKGNLVNSLNLSRLECSYKYNYYQIYLISMIALRMIL